MSQQINLLNPELLTRQDWLDARRMAQLAGTMLLLILIAYGWTSDRVNRLGQEHQVVTAELASLKHELDQSLLRHMPRAPGKALQEEVALAEAALRSRQQILEFLRGGGFGKAQGFSGYMEAFARQRVQGLWLTGFSIDDTVSQIRISGRALQPDLVPQYIAGLGRESILSGREFAALEMGVVEPAATVAGQPATAMQSIVQFRLQSLEKLPAQDGTSSATTERKP